MAIYFGFAIADSMFNGNVVVSREEIDLERAKSFINAGAIPCLNPSHTATVEAMKEWFGINIKVPDEPPKVSLTYGDSLIVMAVRGLPRLADRRHYSREEIQGAGFKFSKYEVCGS